jgi:hypothetical protein
MVKNRDIPIERYFKWWIRYQHYYFINDVIKIMDGIKENPKYPLVH